VGPLQGIRIIEIAGIGPGQFCGMLLADMGAKLIRIDRIGDADIDVPLPERYNLMNRSRPAIAVDLKHEDGVKLVLDFCERADGLFEGFRPGVMERLGLGPAECMARNKRLVYGRMTGWGQTGPLSSAAGHDGNYAGLSGAISAIGEHSGPPVIPLNLVADFGGGGAYLALGMLAALLEAGRSGEGQIVDAAMVDGAASLMTLFYGLKAGGLWRDDRGRNFLDGAAPFYRPYATRDGKYVIVCAIERHFFRNLLETLSIEDIDPADQFDDSNWHDHIACLQKTFLQKTRDEWCDIFEDVDACVSPVLSLAESPQHPHNMARETFVKVDGITQPAPAPRFSRTPSEISAPPGAAPDTTGDALTMWGIMESEQRRLQEAGVISKT